MKHSRRLIAVMSFVISLTAAACFRPAGETVSPTQAPEQIVQPINSPEPLVPTDALPTVNPDASPNISVTLNAATAIPTATAASSLGSTQGIESNLPITLMPLDNVVPTSTIASAPIVVTLANVTLSPMFITPGVPLAPITLQPAELTNSALNAPTSTPSGLITPTSLPGTGDDCLYVVVAGDSLYLIALNNDVTLEELREVNPDLEGEAPILQPGQQLNLPGCESETTTATTGQIIESLPTVSGVIAGPTPAGEIYVVQPGDTVYGIALSYGTTVDAIAAANNLDDPTRIDVGDELIIPPPEDD